jgi:type IV pilus assembly protein PilE
MTNTSSPLPRLPHDQGFTLIEMMITVVIVSILSAVALPAYTDYVKRGKFPDASANLSAKQLQIEQFFLDRRTYVGAPGCASDTTASKYFDFACSTVVATSATSYQLEATGKNSMAGFSFTINQNNVKTTSATPTGWIAATPNTCWITNKGGVC